MKKRIAGRTVPRGVIEDKGRIYARVSVGGKLVKKSFGATKDPNALNAAIRFVNKYHDDARLGRQGLERAVESITVEEGARLYWEHVGSKKPTAVDYARVLRNFSKMFGSRALESMTGLDIEAYRRARGEEGLSPSSQNREHTLVTAMFNALKRLRKLKVIGNIRLPEENPGSAVRRVSEKPFRRKRVLSPEEFDCFLKSSTVQIRRAALAAVHTGLRFKDLAGLNVENVNAAAGTLEGTQAKTGKPFSVPISATMGEIIETRPGREILDMTNFRKEFERAKARAGLDFEWRDLRRTGARMMLVQGVDLATVSSFLGHATLAMTEAYVGAQAEHKRAAVEALAGLYRAPEPDPEPGAAEVSDSAKNAGKVSDLVSVR